MTLLIGIDKEHSYITGASDELISLGELLIAKGKLKNNLSAIYVDATLPIHINIVKEVNEDNSLLRSLTNLDILADRNCLCTPDQQTGKDPSTCLACTASRE